MYHIAPIVLSKSELTINPRKTPSPFRLSRRQPSTRRSGPQFANTPRFLLSQTTPQKYDNDDIIDDDDYAASPSAPVATATPASQRIPPRWKKDVIEDYDDDELPASTYTGTRRRAGRELKDDAIESSPPKPASPGFLDTDFEALFAADDDRHKRRRVDAQPTLAQKLQEGREGGEGEQNKIKVSSSSSPEALQHNFLAPESPATRSAYNAPPQTPHPTRNAQATSTPSIKRPPRPPASTSTGIKVPAPSTQAPPSSTPFRSKPRFMLSARQISSSQSAGFATQPQPPTQIQTHTPSSSQFPSSTPLEKRKPTFVLPRSPPPSAKPAPEDIPTPFSPSSRTLRRRGRQRAGAGGASSYVPGGMAAEVRGWILETGTKREQAVAVPRVPVDYSEARVAEDLGRYLVGVRVVGVRHAVLSSAGPLAFITAEVVAGAGGDGSGEEVLHILAIGPARSKPRLSVRSAPGRVEVGDLLGFLRGLAWDVDLRESSALLDHEEVQGLLHTQEDDGIDRAKKRWLVAMEWDLVQEAKT
ncbi:hypothetical protein N7454_010573 [Penicillium verhagenii]|nr:hypothetical protein N7454_010573 [Penicillium verhagenii]